MSGNVEVPAPEMVPGFAERWKVKKRKREKGKKGDEIHKKKEQQQQEKDRIIPYPTLHLLHLSMLAGS